MFEQITAFLWWVAFTPWIAGSCLNTAIMLGIIAGTRLVAYIVLGICDPDDTDCEGIE